MSALITVDDPMKIPSHATVEKIQEKFSKEIQSVTKMIAAGEDLSSGTELDPGLLAVINRGEQQGRPPKGGGEDLLKSHVVAVKGTFSLRNGAGVAILTVDGVESTVIIRNIPIDGSHYWFCFEDWK